MPVTTVSSLCSTTQLTHGKMPACSSSFYWYCQNQRTNGLRARPKLQSMHSMLAYAYAPLLRPYVHLWFGSSSESDEFSCFTMFTDHGFICGGMTLTSDRPSATIVFNGPQSAKRMSGQGRRLQLPNTHSTSSGAAAVGRSCWAAGCSIPAAAAGLRERRVTPSAQGDVRNRPSDIKQTADFD